jgi:hypothetical protein
MVMTVLDTILAEPCRRIRKVPVFATRLKVLNGRNALARTSANLLERRSMNHVLFDC